MKPALENIRIKPKKLRCRVFSSVALWVSLTVGILAVAPEVDEAMRLLQTHCVDCHRPEKSKGDLVMTTRAALLKGSADGEVLIPGDRARSVLHGSLLPDADPHMPPKKQLANDEIDALGQWIDAGANWDEAAFARHARKAIRYDLKPLPAGYAPTQAFAATADGAAFIVGQGARVIWRGDGIERQMEPHPEVIRSLAFHPDGSTFAVGSFGQVQTISGKTTRTAQLPPGRITSLCYAEEGKVLYAAWGNPGQPAKVFVLSSDDLSIRASWTAHDDEIYTLVLQPKSSRLLSAGADRTIRVWDTQSQELIRKQEGHTDAVYALAFSPDGKWLASAGADKTVALWEADSDVQEHTVKNYADELTGLVWSGDSKYVYALDRKGTLLRSSPTDKSGRVMSSCGELAFGLQANHDASKFSAAGISGKVHQWTGAGKLEGQPAEKEVARTSATRSFVHDVLPILSKSGCVTSECHARNGGQAGFQLSIFSYDPRADFYEITRDGYGRRIMPADPTNSLLLLKATGTVAHEGGERFAVDSPFYQTIHEWLSNGMAYQHEDEPEVVGVRLTPEKVTGRSGVTTTFTASAEYSDGSIRDVSALVSFELSSKDLARISEDGELTVGDGVGETMVIARFMGQVAIAPVVVPPKKLLPPEAYADLPQNNFIDALAYQRHQELGLLPSALCDDETFLRRSALDLIGRMPTLVEVAYAMENRTEDWRGRWVSHLLLQPGYADYWAIKWVDLVRPNPDRAGVKSVYLIDLWLREAFAENMPYDQFVRELLTAKGSTHAYGPAVMFRDRRTPSDLTTMFSQIFLGMRLECAKCHHHPNEKWSQKDFYQLAAFFKDVKRKGTGVSPPISGSAEYIYFTGGGEVKHPVTDEVMALVPLDGDAPVAVAKGVDPRVALADWMLEKDNLLVARAIVNRVWAEFFGIGFVNPVDDFRASNPVSNPALLDALAKDFVAQGYDLKQLMRTITSSRLYQLSTEPNQTNVHDTQHFSRAYRRRMQAEVLADMVLDVTGSSTGFSGVPSDARAMETWNFKLKSEFLDAFGRPDISADPPCERDRETTLVQALHLMHSPQLHDMISRKGARVDTLARSDLSNEEIVEELYLSCFATSAKQRGARGRHIDFFAPEQYTQPADRRCALGLDEYRRVCL